jgi:GT2 family glycosyltransferase
LTATKIDISFVIVNWNTKDLILQCIDSLISKKGNYTQEIIVVDNASCDGSSNAIKEKHPEVQLIQNSQNLGFAKANNIGIKKSEGAYICLLNSDIQVLDNTISFMINYMNNNKDVGLSGPKILWPDMTLQHSCMNYPSIRTHICETFLLNRLFSHSALFSGEYMFFFNHDKSIKVDWLIGCFMLIRREVLENVGLLDELFFIYSEETDLCKRMHEAGWEIVFLPEVSAIHHNASSSNKNPVRFSAEQTLSALKYCKKHRALSVRVFFLLLILFHHSTRLAMCYFMHMFNMKNRKSIEALIEKHEACISTIVKFHIN